MTLIVPFIGRVVIGRLLEAGKSMIGQEVVVGEPFPACVLMHVQHVVVGRVVK